MIDLRCCTEVWTGYNNRWRVTTSPMTIPFLCPVLLLLSDRAFQDNKARAGFRRCARHANFTVFATMPSVTTRRELSTQRLGHGREWPHGALRLRPQIRRLLHGTLRRRALSRLRDAPALHSVLFVCTGNLYRSPFAAERFLAALPTALASRVRVDSRGFAGAGVAVPPAAVAAALEYGVDLRDHHSSLFDRARRTEWDLIVVMEQRHARILQSLLHGHAALTVCLGDLDPNPYEPRSIPDPSGESAEVLRQCYARVARCVRALAAAIADQPASPRATPT